MGLPLRRVWWLCMAVLLSTCQSQVSDISSYVVAHNKRRCLHDVRGLIWSSGVATSAQRHASKCLFQHTANPVYGENLWAGWYDPSAEEVLKGWYDNEIGLYSYSSPGFSSATGHFTQVVWKSTSELGCGICDGGGLTYPYVVTCQYNGFGNVGGQFASNVLPVSRTPSQCTNINCGTPSQTGFDFTGCTNTFPGVCNPTCRPGYWSYPYVSATCLPSGEWAYQGTCTAFTCGSPNHPDPNVDLSTCMDTSGMAYEGTCRPTCKPGFSGSPTAVCGVDAQWTYGGSCSGGGPTPSPSPSAASESPSPSPSASPASPSASPSPSPSPATPSPSPPSSPSPSPSPSYPPSPKASPSPSPSPASPSPSPSPSPLVSPSPSPIPSPSASPSPSPVGPQLPYTAIPAVDAPQLNNPLGKIVYGPKTIDPDCQGAFGDMVPVKCCTQMPHTAADFRDRGQCTAYDANYEFSGFLMNCSGGNFTWGNCDGNCDCNVTKVAPARSCMLLEHTYFTSAFVRFSTCDGQFAPAPGPQASNPQGSIIATPVGVNQTLDPDCAAAPGATVPAKCCLVTAGETWLDLNGVGTCVTPDPTLPGLNLGLTCANDVFLLGDMCSDATCGACAGVHRVPGPACVALTGVTGYALFAKLESCPGTCSPFAPTSAACQLLTANSLANPQSFFTEQFTGAGSVPDAVLQSVLASVNTTMVYRDPLTESVMAVLSAQDPSTTPLQRSNTSTFTAVVRPQSETEVVGVFAKTDARIGVPMPQLLMTDVLRVDRFDASQASVTDQPYTFSVYVPDVLHLDVMRYPTRGSGGRRSVVAEGGSVLPWGSGWWNVTAVGTSLFAGVNAATNFSVALFPVTRGSVARVTITFQTSAPEFMGNQIAVELPDGFTPHRCGQGFTACATQSTILLVDTNTTVSHRLVTDGHELSLQLDANLTINGSVQFTFTNVLLPNHCDEAEYSLRGQSCSFDAWGAKSCEARPMVRRVSYKPPLPTDAVFNDGVPQGCDVCSACKAHPAGHWECEHDGLRFLSPNPGNGVCMA